MPILESVGTAVPGDPIPQSAVKDKAAKVIGDIAPDLLRHLKVFDTTGITQRHLIRPLDWYLQARKWRERSEVYKTEGMALIEAAANRALDAAHAKPVDIDGIVFVSTTGISTPSLDARLVNQMKFRSDVTRTPVWGLGCAGGVAGLSLAASLARAHPTKRYLLLSLEICSLAFNLAELDVRSFVAATLFADGAAAAVISGDKVEGQNLGRWRNGSTHEWPHSEDVMGWDVDDVGLSVIFSREIPDIVEKEMQPIVAAYLAREKVKPDRYVFHPGGTKVIQAYEKALGLNGASMDAAKNVLARYGNMSSPTVLFALQESIKEPLKPGETALLAALGPGFASELILLEGTK